MGQKLSISDVTFTDTTLPILRDDLMLSSGSLFLWDPGHSLGTFTGIPIGGASMPNVAWKECASVLGSGTQSSLSATVAVNSGTAANQFFLERTPKGGIHGIVSQVGQTGANQFILSAPAAVNTYVRTNKAHSFFWSAWWKVTRNTIGTGNAAPQSLMEFADNTSAYIMYTSNGQFNGPGAPNGSVIGSRSPANPETTIALGSACLVNGGTTGYNGAGPTANFEFGVGNYGAWTGFNQNKSPSRILYRCYFEDLTVSGRTYAQCDAIDNAMFTAAFASGGKFFGDTYTAVSTLP